MPLYIEFPAGCKARGRNGNFTPATLRVSTIDERTGVVSIFSRSEGPTPPVFVTGPRTELARLLREAAEQLAPEA
jgi:hypothetical protein